MAIDHHLGATAAMPTVLAGSSAELALAPFTCCAILVRVFLIGFALMAQVTGVAIAAMAGYRPALIAKSIGDRQVTTVSHVQVVG